MTYTSRELEDEINLLVDTHSPYSLARKLIESQTILREVQSVLLEMRKEPSIPEDEVWGIENDTHVLSD